MTLEVGEIVSRVKLSEYVGAGGQSCILHKKNTMVALAMKPELNPDAPNVLLVGKGPKKEKYAKILLADGNHGPVFTKKASNQWENCGEFKAEKIDHNRQLITLQSQRCGRRDIWGVLYLTSSTN